MPIGFPNGDQYKDDLALQADPRYDTPIINPDEFVENRTGVAVGSEWDYMESSPVPQEQRSVSQEPMLQDIDYQVSREGGVTRIQPLREETLPEKLDIIKNYASGVVDKITGPDRHVTWPEKAFNSLVEAFKLPGDVAQGKIDPSSPEAAGRAFELAGALVFGPAPIAKKVIDGTLGSFAGVTSKALDKKKLNEANLMHASGDNPEAIWKQTGMWKGADGRWRYEIPDTDMKFAPLEKWKEVNNNLGDVIDHPELFKAYPQFKNVRLDLDTKLEGPAAVRGELIIINPKMINSERDLKRALIHEIQHLIQRHEKFEFQGTNPKSAGERSVLELFRKVMNTEEGPERDALIKLYQDIKDNEKDMGWYLYNRNPGEVEANLSMRRFELNNPPMSPMQTKQWLEDAGHSFPDLPIHQLDASASYMKATPEAIEGIMNKYAKKEITSTEMHKQAEKLGWKLDMPRSKYDNIITATDPSGKTHKLSF